MAWQSTTNFEHGTDGWRALNLSNSVSLRRVADGTARAGSTFLRCRTSALSGSVAADLSTVITMQGVGDGGGPGGGPGPIALSLQLPALSVDAWVRAAPGGPAISATLTIWELFRANDDNHPNMSFVVGPDWTRISHCIRLLGASPQRARIEFYLGTVNADFDIDCISVG